MPATATPTAVPSGIPSAMASPAPMPSAAVPAPAPANVPPGPAVAVIRIVIRIRVRRIIIVVIVLRHVLNVSDGWLDDRRRLVDGRGVGLRRSRRGSRVPRLDQHGREDGVGNALLPQVNDLPGIQAIGVPGVIDVGDDGVIADFGLFQFDDLADAVGQGRRGGDTGVLGRRFPCPPHKANGYKHKPRFSHISYAKHMHFSIEATHSRGVLIDLYGAGRGILQVF